MPNWISNYLTVTDDPFTIEQQYEPGTQVPTVPSPDISRFMDTAMSEDELLSLESIAPLPELDDHLQVHVPSAIWGCKWDTDRVIRRFEGDELKYFFDTSWDPPINAILSVSRRFPRLIFNLEWLDKQGHLTGGDITICNGGLLNDKYTPQILYDFVRVEDYEPFLAAIADNSRKGIENQDELTDEDKATLLEAIGLNPSLGGSQ